MKDIITIDWDNGVILINGEVWDDFKHVPCVNLVDYVVDVIVDLIYEVMFERMARSMMEVVNDE